MEKLKNRPVLRFPEFSGDWKMKKFGEVTNSKSAKYNPEKESESFKCIELEHLATETGQLLGFVDSINSGSIKNKFEKGDVLFGKLRPYLKKYLQAPFAGVCSSEIWVLKGIDVSNDFLYRIVQTDAFVELANQSTGSKMPRADWDVVSSGLFAFPSLNEQTKIATFLTSVDEKLNQLKKKKSLLEQYKKGVMQQIFNQEIRFKQDDGNEFPDWEEKSLGECLDYEQPTNYLVSNTEYDNSYETPVLTAGKTFILGFTNETNGIFKDKLPVIIFDDFTTATQFVNFPFKAKSSAMKILSPKESINIKFMFEAMQLIKYELGGHERHWISKFTQIEISIPCDNEQTKIANFLSAIDEKINQCSTQIGKMELWKKGLLQKMFC